MFENVRKMFEGWGKVGKDVRKMFEKCSKDGEKWGKIYFIHVSLKM